ncbi:uncharacterized protein LOC143919901 [Arctopsyche grandis]|uniref:uncharacterized protein LOC143919901 n=1 Tax=Arctopsyche grandis TaxID=121162 RepID=UPI00406D7981
MESSFESLGPPGPLGPLKLEYNNDVMKLKKYFVQAKTQIINSLSKKVKKFKSHKGADTLKEKIDKKVESIVAEILLLKKLKYNEVANFAMVNNEELHKLMNTPVVTQEKVMAKMISHKALKSKLDILKNKFMVIPTSELLEPNPKKVRQKKIKLRRKAKENSSNAKNKQDTVNSNNGNDDDSENSDNDNSENGDFENEQGDSGASNVSKDLCKKLDIDVSNIKTKKKSMLSKVSKVAKVNNVSVVSTSDFSVASLDDNHVDMLNDTVEDLKVTSVRKSKDIKIGSKKPPMSSGADNDIDEIVSESLVSKKNRKICDRNEKLIDLDLNMTPGEKSKDFENSSKNLQVPSNSDDDVNENISEYIVPKKERKISNKIKNLIDLDNIPSDEQIQKTADSFFVTESGDRYMTMSLPRAPDKLDEDSFSIGENRKMRRAAFFGNEVLRPKKQIKTTNPSKRSYSEMSYPENSTDRQSSSRFKKNFDKPAQNGLRDRSVPEIPEKLHPSWEAKKQKSAIVNFQGSKIVFDD